MGVSCFNLLQNSFLNIQNDKWMVSVHVNHSPASSQTHLCFKFALFGSQMVQKMHFQLVSYIWKLVFCLNHWSFSIISMHEPTFQALLNATLVWECFVFLKKPVFEEFQTGKKRSLLLPKIVVGWKGKTSAMPTKPCMNHHCGRLTEMQCSDVAMTTNDVVPWHHFWNWQFWKKGFLHFFFTSNASSPAMNGS